MWNLAERIGSFGHDAAMDFLDRTNRYSLFLARQGFYWRDGEIVCHKCLTRTSAEALRDNDEPRHTTGCEALTDTISYFSFDELNPEGESNHPTVVQVTNESTQVCSSDLINIKLKPDKFFHSLTSRRETFNSLSWQISDSLAEAGFYYGGVKDQIRCHACAFILVGWHSTGVDVRQKHLEMSPQCPRARSSAPSLSDTQDK